MIWEVETNKRNISIYGNLQGSLFSWSIKAAEKAHWSDDNEELPYSKRDKLRT